MTEQIEIAEEINWKELKRIQQQQKIQAFHLELEDLKNKYGIKILPKITIVGTEIFTELVYAFE